jgi:hypothetical protein
MLKKRNDFIFAVILKALAINFVPFRKIRRFQRNLPLVARK